jgi:hypothetical protein
MENDLKKLEEKRTRSIFGAFCLMIKLGYIDGSKFTMNSSLLKSVVKHYLQDLLILKIRYGIKDKVQPQKTAGLTTAGIMRFKPVLPKNTSDETLFESDVNELLAIFHGLCLCAEQEEEKISLEAVAALWAKSEFPEWLSNFRYLLKFRNYTAENLALVFDTLVRFAR